MKIKSYCSRDYQPCKLLHTATLLGKWALQIPDEKLITPEREGVTGLQNRGRLGVGVAVGMMVRQVGVKGGLAGRPVKSLPSIGKV